MQSGHEQQPLWLRWFLSAENADETALRTALRVVPTEFWTSVSQDTNRGLDALSVSAAVRSSTLEMKRLLMFQENARRDAGTAPRSVLIERTDILAPFPTLSHGIFWCPAAWAGTAAAGTAAAVVRRVYEP